MLMRAQFVNDFLSQSKAGDDIHTTRNNIFTLLPDETL